MAKYVVKWNTGCGDSYDVIERDSEEAAEKYAYESWREEAEGSAVYSADLLTDDIIEEYDLNMEDYE